MLLLLLLPVAVTAIVHNCCFTAQQLQRADRQLTASGKKGRVLLHCTYRCWAVCAPTQPQP